GWSLLTMTDHDNNPWYERFLAPYALFLGMAASFVGCCFAGALVSRQSSFAEFERFHTFINLATLYHPTASQVRALAKSRLDPDKIVVIVGGSSVLHGSGMRGGHVWTTELQAQL